MKLPRPEGLGQPGHPAVLSSTFAGCVSSSVVKGHTGKSSVLGSPSQQGTAQLHLDMCEGTQCCAVEGSKAHGGTHQELRNAMNSVKATGSSLVHRNTLMHDHLSRQRRGSTQAGPSLNPPSQMRASTGQQGSEGRTNKMMFIQHCTQLVTHPQGALRC